MLKIYTQEEFNAIPRDVNGIKRCPTGDYSQIKEFGDKCYFADGCVFGAESSFGKECSFGRYCSFGERCSFGRYCSFGERCSFGRYCRFGMWCRFGEWCGFGKGCSHEGLTNSRFITVGGIGSAGRTTCFFKADEGYFVRSGGFFGTFDEFAQKVKETHSGTKHEADYMAALAFAKQALGYYEQEAGNAEPQI